MICSIQRLARCHSDDHQQRQRKALHQGLGEFGREETGIRIVGIVVGSKDRPFVQLHCEVKSGDKDSQGEHPLPANQTPAAQHDQYRKRRADQNGVRDHGNCIDEIVRGAQPVVRSLPSFRNLQKFQIAAGSITLDCDLQSVWRVFDPEACAFPGESPVRAVRSGEGVGLLRQKGVSR